jgi:predicted glycoside hydrolase/deacetylase ChbG (UPF0249 family)
VTAELSERFLIVNADDFGLTSGVNRGIIEAHERGIVTSASLMVRGSGANEAAGYARAHRRLSVGLHIDLAEWRFRAGEWVPAYEVVDASDGAAVKTACERQLNAFRQLMQSEPTHLDSHQHLHLSEPARAVVSAMAIDLGVPLRSCSPVVTYCGSFYGQTGEGEPYPEGISVAALVRLIDNLPPGWTELGCHPGYSDGLDSVYSREREEELRPLCSDEVREALRCSDVQLRPFPEAPDRRRASTRD